MNCSHSQLLFLLSLLIGLLWYIWDTPLCLIGHAHSASTPSVGHVLTLCCLFTQSLVSKATHHSDSFGRFFVKVLVLGVLSIATPTQARGGAIKDWAWCGLSLNQQVEAASLVAEASVVSRSSVRNGFYHATFRIDKLINGDGPSLTVRFLRLRLGTKRNRGSQANKGICTVSGKVRPRTRYVVMARRREDGEEGVDKSKDHYSLVAPPLKAGKKLTKKIQNLVCKHCDQHVKISTNTRGRVRRGKRRHGSEEDGEEETPGVENEGKDQKTRKMTRLSCSARGNPPPTLYWTMDGVKVTNSQTTRIITKKISKYLRKSILKMRGHLHEESSRLKCHAHNSLGHDSRLKMGHEATSPPTRKSSIRRPPSSSSSIRSSSSSSIRRPPSQLTYFRNDKKYGVEKRKRPLFLGSQCPIDNYCMNGGTCLYYRDIGEVSCHCAPGYIGRRCDRKYVIPGRYTAQVTGKTTLCLVGMAHYPC